MDSDKEADPLKNIKGPTLYKKRKMHFGKEMKKIGLSPTSELLQRLEQHPYFSLDSFLEKVCVCACAK